jgi:leucyl/phenylalanyl-tRNA--protein transferase
VYLLDERLRFPRPELADPSGLLAVGGDLSPRRLLLAYANAIFPWYDASQPILWHSPPWRMVVYPETFHVGRTTEKWVRREAYSLKWDTDFAGVLAGCGDTPRPGQNGTWLTPEMREAYLELHRLGHAHSAEAWQDGRLVGGLYGVVMGTVFFGESMFSHAPNASKVVFATLARRLFDWGYTFIDCQVYTDHLSRFGGVEVERSVYLEQLSVATRGLPTRAWPRTERPPGL